MRCRNQLFLLVMILFTLSCKKQEVQNTQVCALIDVTDEKFQDTGFTNENLPHILKLMKLDEENGGYSGGEVKISLINEISDSKSKSVLIEPAETGMLGENPLNRRDEVKRFKAELEQSFSSVLDETNWGTDASKIYQKVVRELIKMKKKEADRYYLVIYSDMLENSELFSFYGANWQQKIQKMAANPEETIEELSKKGPAIPDLSEFDIFVVVSRNEGNDEKINLSEQFWTSIFEYQGATVTFNSNLEI